MCPSGIRRRDADAQLRFTATDPLLVGQQKYGYTETNYYSVRGWHHWL